MRIYREKSSRPKSEPTKDTKKEVKQSREQQRLYALEVKELSFNIFQIDIPWNTGVLKCVNEGEKV